MSTKDEGAATAIVLSLVVAALGATRHNIGAGVSTAVGLGLALSFISGGAAGHPEKRKNSI